MQEWIKGLPWWAKWAFTAGLGLMSAFAASVFPAPWALIGFCSGFALVVVAVIGVGWHSINVRLATRGKPSLKLQPIHIIALGLLISLSGVAWHIYSGSMATPVSIIASGKTPLKRMFTAYDIEERQKAVDSIDTALSKLLEIRGRSQDFSNRTDELINARNGPDALEKYANDAEPILNNIGLIADTYRARFPEIAAIVLNSENYHLVSSIPSNSRNLKGEIIRMSTGPDFLRNIQNSRFMLEWLQSIRALHPWLEKQKN